MSDERNARLSSVLGAAAVVIGNVNGQGDVEVRGRVQGNIVLEGRVLVARGGIVLGSIEALQVTVVGAVRGDLVASDGVTIHASAEVEGNIHAPRVAIEAGAQIRGHLRTEPLAGKKAEASEGTSAEPRAPEPRAPEPRASEPRIKEPRPSLETHAPASSPEDRPPSPRRTRRRGKGGSHFENGGAVEARSTAAGLEPPAPRLAPQVPAPAAPVPAAPAPTASSPRDPAPRPPTIPTFRKGSHGHRRDS